MNRIHRPAVTPLFLLMALITLQFSSCMKKESYPDVPEIAYESFAAVYDTGRYPKSAILTISFRDGDGDIGLRFFDTLPPYQKNGQYYYNYVIEYFEKRMGTFVKVDLDPPFSARIPWLTPDDQNKAIKGIIVDTLQMNPKPLYDTIRLRFFIYDRALNRSNVDSTPPIILRRQ